MPSSYAEVFAVLGEAGVIDARLAAHLRAAAGLRNLVAHQYGVLDFDRVFLIARDELDDLLTFCQQLSVRAGEDA